MLIQTSLPLDHRGLFSAHHCAPCAEDYHTGSRVLARNTPSFTVTKGGTRSRHHTCLSAEVTSLSLGYCQLTSKLLMLSGGQSLSVSWVMKAKCPLWVSCSGCWEKMDFRGTRKKHLFSTTHTLSATCRHWTVYASC